MWNVEEAENFGGYVLTRPTISYIINLYELDSKSSPDGVALSARSVAAGWRVKNF
jgi:hypothetical protein